MSAEPLTQRPGKFLQLAQSEKLLSSDLELCAAFVVTPLGKWAGLREADKAQGGNVQVFPEGGPLKRPQNNKAAGLR